MHCFFSHNPYGGQHLRVLPAVADAQRDAAPAALPADPDALRDVTGKGAACYTCDEQMSDGGLSDDGSTAQSALEWHPYQAVKVTAFALEYDGPVAKIFIGQVRRRLSPPQVAHMLGVALGSFEVVVRVEKIQPMSGSELGCYHVYVRECELCSLQRRVLVYSDVDGFLVARDAKGYLELRRHVEGIRAKRRGGEWLWHQPGDTVTIQSVVSRRAWW